jgi:hypothetical protein
VSDKFVTDAIQTLDDKYDKLLKWTDDKAIERLEKVFRDLGTKVAE